MVSFGGALEKRGLREEGCFTCVLRDFERSGGCEGRESTKNGCERLCGAPGRGIKGKARNRGRLWTPAPE